MRNFAVFFKTMAQKSSFHRLPARSFLGLIPALMTCLFGLLAPQAMASLTAVSDEVVLRDQVGPDLSSPATKHSGVVYYRVVTRDQNNRYTATITDRKGTPRMTGTYKDAAMHIPDGLFTYFHPNGRMESRGMFRNGNKAGTWHCWQSDGRPRADRIYSGMDWDDLQVSVGLATRATTLGSPMHPDPAAASTATDPGVKAAPQVNALPSKSKGWFRKRPATRP